MADSDLEKFVLQYEVDSAVAIQKLEAFNARVEGVSVSAKKATKGVTDFTADAFDHLGKLVPQLDSVAAGFRAIGSGVGAATLAMGTFAASVQVAMFARDQFNAQRVAGQESGISGLRLYDMERKLRGPNVTPEQVREHFKSTQGILRDYQSNPGVPSKNSMLLGRMNINPAGMTNLDFNAALASRFASMPEAEAIAYADRLGLNKDVARSMRSAGPNLKSSSLSNDEVSTYEQGAKATADLNTKLSDFNKAMTELGLTLGNDVMPYFTQFVNGLSKTFDSAGRKEEAHRVELAGNKFIELQKGKGWFQALTDAGKDHSTADAFALAQIAAEKKQASEKGAADKQAKLVEQQMDAEDASNAALQTTISQFQLAVNAFSASINTFSGITDERHAWAIWAGEAGRAAGLGGGRAASFTSSTGTVSYDEARGNAGFSGNTPYDSIIENASKVTGIPTSILRGVIGVESKFKPRAVSEAGAQGLMQVMPANFKSLGITDGMDPTQNIMGGSKLLKGYLDRAHGDMNEALMMYHGGLDRSGWGPRTQSYPGKVLGYGAMIGPRATAWDPTARSPYTFGNSNVVRIGGGESFAKARLRGVKVRTAADLGIPVDQVSQGGYSAADAGWVLGKDYNDLNNQRRSTVAAMSSPGLDPGMSAKLYTDLINIDRNLQNMREYGAQTINGGNGDNRTITLGMNPTFNIYGASQDDIALGQKIDQHLQTTWHAISNEATSFKR